MRWLKGQKELQRAAPGHSAVEGSKSLPTEKRATWSGHTGLRPLTGLKVSEPGALVLTSEGRRWGHPRFEE